MKTKMIKAVSLVAALACILCFPVKASATTQQGTDGTELEVVQAQQLEVQLGQAWSGVEFQLRTDAGKYPDPIPVGEDGVLRVEIGGSEKYMLTCLASRVEIPSPEDLESTEETATGETGTEATEENADETTDTAEETLNGSEATDESFDATEVIEPESDAQIATIGGIPVTHVIIFVGGLVIAIALLVFMQMHQRNREVTESEDDDEV